MSTWRAFERTKQQSRDFISI